MQMITIELDCLPQHLHRNAKYLEALARYNALRNDMISKIGISDLKTETEELDGLQALVHSLEPDWRVNAISSGEAVRRFGFSTATLTRLARTGYVGAEKRGNRWYFSVDDLELKRSQNISEQSQITA